MDDRVMWGRRRFGTLLAGGAAVALGRVPPAWAATPDGAGAVPDMLAVLQAAKALSFTADLQFGAAVAKDGLRTLGNRAGVVFERPDRLFAVFGAGGEPDVRLLISDGAATLFRLSMASKTVLKLAPENGAAFSVPGLFIPFLGLLADNPEAAFFGGVKSVTPVAEGSPGQSEQTTLSAVMGAGFTGELWVNRSTSLPERTTGTWFGTKGDMAASAAVTFSAWSSEAPVAGAFTVQGLDAARSVTLDGLGL